MTFDNSDVKLLEKLIAEKVIEYKKIVSLDVEGYFLTDIYKERIFSFIEEMVLRNAHIKAESELKYFNNLTDTLYNTAKGKKEFRQKRISKCQSEQFELERSNFFRVYLGRKNDHVDYTLHYLNSQDYIDFLNNEFKPLLNPELNLHLSDWIRYKSIEMQLKTLDSSNEITSNSKKTNVFQWQKEPEKLKLLYSKLVDNFISRDTTFDTFEKVFAPVQSDITGKIVWLKRARTHDLNKKSVIEFFDILNSNNYISIKHSFGKNEFDILNSCVTDKDNNELKFTASNKPTSESPSEWCCELEEIIRSL
ncbi:MAG: hypothetical protein P4L41_02985 [Flavipsychrobacter sp.]|nr:hypothetical protein [Flavipsychrobacter sp.]